MTAKVKGGASGKLYGKVTGKEVAELLTALTGTEIDKEGRAAFRHQGVRQL
ncbi:hypothetical protein NIA69_16385 [Gemmiger formicilis]|nr:hypothetical protein [Gemmiger formicilis]